MCDPATAVMLGMTALSTVSTLFGKKGDTVVNTPPAAEHVAAIAAPTARKGGADVRLGRDVEAKAKGVPSEAKGFKEKRKTVAGLGGLGRSGLVF